MIDACVLGVAVRGPGLDGWAASRPILAGASPWVWRPIALPPTAILPATERRRASAVTRLALSVAEEAVAASGLAPSSLRSVFGSSLGDGLTVGSVLEAINHPDGFVSPTQFHNSVHNAAAGYWSIAVGSSRPATSLGCHDGTFGAALMKALAECCVEQEPVLLVVYDVPFPSPLNEARPIGEAFGMALVLAPSGAGPRLAASWHSTPAATTLPDDGLCRLTVNPAAHGLALLRLLARGQAGRVTAALLDGHLMVELCA